jgi:putative oxidoreductase
MKIAILIIRILMGLMLIMGSLVFFYNMVKQAEPPKLEGDMKVFFDGIIASVYVMPLVKIIELLCGIAFVSGRFIPLATVVIFPITLNIVLVNTFLGPKDLAPGLFLLLANLFLAYTYRKNYEPMLAAK